VLRRLQNRVRFRIERLLLRGALYRLLFIAGLIGLISLVAGLLLMEVEQDFSRPGEAIWWAFLRLTDPGYLGDDEGVAKRAISTALTTLGLMVFVGMLVAVLTQWLTHTVRNLERGLTPIVQSGHVLILGWTNRTASIVQELILSEERTRHFLRRHGKRHLRLVILAKDVDPAMVQELRDTVGQDWDPQQVIFRTGSPLHIDHLERADFTHASAIILPGEDFSPEGSAVLDARTCKALLSISRHGRKSDEPMPLLVTEVFDARNLHPARAGYDGPVELIASDVFVSRLMAQAVRHPGMSHVFGELLGRVDEGNEIYVRGHADMVGRSFEELAAAFPRAVVLGVVRPSGDSFSPILNPPGGFVVDPEDRLVLVAETYGDTESSDSVAPARFTRGVRSEIDSDIPGKRRVLVLGWNHKVPALLEEFDSYAHESFEIDILSGVSETERDAAMGRHDLRLQRVEVRQLDGDYTAPSVMAGALPQSYDNIVVLASELVPSVEDADSRTILACLLLRDLRLRNPSGFPHVLVELMDPENAHLLPAQLGETLVTPSILSHMLAQVALRHELRTVFDELFGSGGAEIFFRPAGHYQVADRELSFAEIQEMTHGHGEIALGVRLPDGPATEGGGVRLNPPPDSRWRLSERDELVVVATHWQHKS